MAYADGSPHSLSNHLKLGLQALQAVKILGKISQDDKEPAPDKVTALLEENNALSREVVDTLVAAKQAKDSTDHLLRTWEARHDLPRDDASLDPDMFPRPPPNSRREVRLLQAVAQRQDMPITPELWPRCCPGVWRRHGGIRAFGGLT